MPELMRTDFIVGRILISLLFIIAGLMLIFRRGDFKYLSGLIGSRGVPLPNLVMILSIIIETVGGIMVAIGFYTWIVAAVLILWMIPTTLVVHAPWKAPPEMFTNEVYHTLKNVSIAGGLLVLIAVYRP